MNHLPERNKKALAKKIRYYKDLHFPGKGSGQRLADEVGVAPQTISNWLSGRRLPTIAQLYSLAKVFDVSPLELCGATSKNKSHSGGNHISMLAYLLNHGENSIPHTVNSNIKDKIIKELKHVIGMELR